MISNLKWQHKIDIETGFFRQHCSVKNCLTLKFITIFKHLKMHLHVIIPYIRCFDNRSFSLWKICTVNTCNPILPYCERLVLTVSHMYLYKCNYSATFRPEWVGGSKGAFTTHVPSNSPQFIWHIVQRALNNTHTWAEMANMEFFDLYP